MDAKNIQNDFYEEITYKDFLMNSKNVMTFIFYEEITYKDFLMNLKNVMTFIFYEEIAYKTSYCDGL
jgi:hypothetical protein